jgi:hypothetical protein
MTVDKEKGTRKKEKVTIGRRFAFFLFPFSFSLSGCLHCQQPGNGTFHAQLEGK